MRVVVQRSKKSYVNVNNKTVGKIDFGLVLLVGFTIDDEESDIDYIVKKIINLRIFDDESNIMNLSLKDLNKQVLSISQFTLYASTKKGNRPSYSNALSKEKAIDLYDLFNKKLTENKIDVQTGIFGAKMDLFINNDGPITIIIDSKENSVI